jgi:hypothetical protein
MPGSGALQFTFEKATIEGKVTFVILASVVVLVLYFALRRKKK